MQTFSTSLNADAGGKSTKLAITTTSAQSITYTPPLSMTGTVLVTPDAACFFRYGASPTAVSDGTDIYLSAGNSYRVQIGGAGKFAFIALTGTGNVYLTQEF